MNDSDKNELLWKQYELHVKTYKDYLELALKINVFYYAITGAIVSYYFAHANQPLMKIALALPIAMSILLGLLFVIGAVLSLNSRKDIRQIGADLGFKYIHEVGVLTVLLFIFAALMLVVALALGVVMICGGSSHA